MRHPEGRYFIEWRQDGRRLRSRLAHRCDLIQRLLRPGCAKECLPCPFISPLRNIAFPRGFSPTDRRLGNHA
jgi:hypothetical protein